MAAGLISVAYVSSEAEPFDDARLAELLTHSRAANRARDVTGMLLHRRGRFFQVVEGPEDAVEELFEKIAVDSRHRDIRVLLREDIEVRRFDEWTMGYEPIVEPTTPPPDGFRDTFDDLASEDEEATSRAVHELTVWFRARIAPAR